MTVVLSAKDLTIEAMTSEGPVLLVDRADLELREGEILGLIGESGSGKTTTVRALMGMLERNVSVREGEISLRGRLVSSPTVDRFKEVRGRHVGMVFQSASLSLNPLMRVEKQLREVLRRHLPELSSEEMREREQDVLRRMGFSDTERVLKSYPHQLSGGMRQRVAIALAVVTSPDVVIADECTSALDVTTQAEVVALLRKLTSESQTAMVFVTHDLLLAREICTRIAVMYAGQIVEVGDARDLVENPQHPYTRALLEAIPTWGSKQIVGIDGFPPKAAASWQGCRFAPRCPVAQDRCSQGQVEWAWTTKDSGARCVITHDEIGASQFRVGSA